MKSRSPIARLPRPVATRRRTSASRSDRWPGPGIGEATWPAPGLPGAGTVPRRQVGLDRNAVDVDRAERGQRGRPGVEEQPDDVADDDLAAAGPIGFIGLTIPHVARLIAGSDFRWMLPYSLLLAPILLLVADVLGRVIARPQEIQVAILTAVIGAPIFIALVQRRRLAAL